MEKTMSSPQGEASPSAAAADAGNPNAGKKAVHVKWAGKTIALGTFPSSEADEKCARAKALTRAWRSTMRPKPTRDWVMVELERLGVRVVSGRLGRKAGEDDDGEPQKSVDMRPVGGGGPPVVDRSMGWSNNPDLDQLMQQRRSSSLGLSMMNDDLNRRSSLSSLGPALGLDGGSLGGDPSMPPHRPLVGGGAAAAYEAARADHYAQKRQEQQRRASSLGLGGLGGGASMPQMGLSVNPNQHYEMLKLHHMNLLNEIQETTLMMNLYQQQQLQQQQQQLQQQQANEGANDQMALLLQQQGGGMDGMFGSGPMGHRGSLGMGAMSSGDITMMRQQQLLQQSGGLSGGGTGGAAPAPTPKKGGSPKKSAVAAAGTDDKGKEETLKSQKEEQKALEEKLKKLKDDIAKRQKEAEEMEKTAKNSSHDEKAASSGGKRKGKEAAKKEAKKIKEEPPPKDDDDDDDDHDDDDSDKDDD